MKKVLVLFLLLFLASYGICLAYRGNASPATVMLDTTTTYQEVTFPFNTRDLYIENYHSTGGIWVNLRGGDTDGVGVNADRVYIAPSSSLTLYDFVTGGITVCLDAEFTSNWVASPVTVIGVY